MFNHIASARIPPGTVVLRRDSIVTRGRRQSEYQQHILNAKLKKRILKNQGLEVKNPVLPHGVSRVFLS